MIKAIPTIYKGIEFRSKTEAKWAVFFDVLKIKWQYETEGYKTSSGNYLPDFYLPGCRCYAEVKPTFADANKSKNIKRFIAFSEGIKKPLILLVDSPNMNTTKVYAKWNSDVDRGFVPFVNKLKTSYGLFWCSQFPPGSHKDKFAEFPVFKIAILTANNYKFSESKIW